MKELHEEEDVGMTSHTLKYGDLKMVKVRRGKKGHRQSRSLVFRISRSSTPIADDSGIKCSSTEEETSSGEEQTKTSPCGLKIRIPKSVLLSGTEKKEINAVEPICLEDSTLQSNNLFSQHKNAFSGKMEVSGASMDDKNQHEDILNTTTGILCDNSGILNSELRHAEAPMNETKSCDLRRSSRRILLRVQKDCQSDLSIKGPSADCHKFPFPSSNSSGQQVHMEEKRKRGRKPGFRASECKKRKYGRRGRPPKSPFPKQLSLVKPGTSGGRQSEKLVLIPPPKNSVWTLVPKELFESEFFKSQLLKMRVSNSSENGIKTNFSTSTPVSFSSTVISQIPVPQTNGLKQAKIPILNVNVPVIREKMPEERDPKRPTVIYFKTEKKKFDYPQDQKRELRNPQLLTQNEVSKTQNDLLYLFNKYRMMEDMMLKNYYELAGGNLNEAESMLSNFISNSPAVYIEEKAPSIYESQVNSSNCAVFDLISSDQAPRPIVDNLIASSEPALEDVDTLSRKIIVKSLQILYSEEATLT